MSVEVTEIDNGLRIVTEDMPHLESAALGVWVKAGSRNERPEQHGIAHFLEHMAFKGTERRSARQIAEEIENVGGEMNAATSVETTAYYARVLKDHVPTAVDMLHDILENSVFDAEELKREQHVILQEIGATQDQPDEIAFEHLQSAAFRGQPIGRPILGTPETVSAFSASDLRNYLSDNYHGPNIVLAAAGAVKHDEIVELAASRFGGFSPDVPSEPPQAKYIGGEVIEKRDLKEAQILLGFEGRAYHVRDFYSSQLLAGILGGGMSSRLFQEVREKRGLCYSIYAFHWGFSDTGMLAIHAATGPEDVEELVPTIVNELRGLSDDISVEELDRAKAQVRAGLMMSQESPASRAGQIARQILLFGRPISNEELLERITAITPERLRDLAQRIFGESEITLSMVGPVDNLMSREAIKEQLCSGNAQAAQ